VDGGGIDRRDPDVPVAAPRRRLSGSRSFVAVAAGSLRSRLPRPVDEDATGTVAGGSLAAYERWWDRIEPIWHTFYLGLVALAIITTAIDGRLDVDRRWIIVGLLTAMAMVYGLVGRRLFQEPGGPRAAVHLTVTWLCFYGIVVTSDGATSAFFVLFALFPQVWAFLAPRVAVVTSIAVILGLMLAEAYLAGWGWSAVLSRAPLAIMQAGLVLLVGLLMVGVIDQTERRAKLIDELAATRSELAETERVRGVLAERERLAHEIHDTLAQGFTSILALSQAIDATLDRDLDAARERLALLERAARDNLAETRALIDALAPVDLRDSTLPAAIERVTRRFSEETGVPADVDLEGARFAFPTPAEIVLLRATQEALANVAKHARAGAVRVTLAYLPAGTGLASLTVVDDGVGFDPASADGFGLRGMRTRVQQIGGSLEVISAPGSGTTVRAHVPARPREAVDHG
jgi:signal transduction histidine kinase